MRAIRFERHGSPRTLERRDGTESAIRRVVDTVLTLAEARRAHPCIHAWQIPGKVVLVP